MCHMAKMDPVQRVAEHVGRMLQEGGPTRLTMLRRRVAGRDKQYFIDACAYAIQRGWAVRGVGDHLNPGRVAVQGVTSQGRKISLGVQLDERLRAGLPGAE